MSKAQTDIRATSYNAATANPNGYVGTIDDVIAQIRAEPNEVRVYWPLNMSRERHELLGFLGVIRRSRPMSGVEMEVYSEDDFDHEAYTEDDSVEYGAPEAPVEPGFYTLAYARKAWPHNFGQ
jgi:hypothetical protein